jgi:predicted aspartyl protease
LNYGDRLEDNEVQFGRLRQPLATIKLGSYDGSSPLETHLAKLENCSQYYRWSARERLCHLKASLEGHAGQVLWGLAPQASEAEIVQLLRNRFGNINQMERFRAELRTRRRKNGESVQSLYQDIRRLLSLGFPGQVGELVEIIGRDSFLEALGDPVLRIRVLDQQPSTLDEALAIVCRMEAYSVTAGETTDENNWGGGGHRRVRWANSLSATALPARETDHSENEKRIQQLEANLSEHRKQLQQLRSAFDRRVAEQSAPEIYTSPMSCNKWSSTMSAAYHPATYNQQRPATATEPQQLQHGSTYERRERTTPSSTRHLDRDTCARCGQKGHWQRSPSCPMRDATQGHVNSSQADIRGVSCNYICSETYLNFVMDGVAGQVLVDSGCDKSVIPRRMVSTVILSPADVQMYAANCTNIVVLGKTRVQFDIQGMPLFADVYVSDDVNEFMLGYDWLVSNNCCWNFDDGILEIHGVPVKLEQRPNRGCIRHVHAKVRGQHNDVACGVAEETKCCSNRADDAAAACHHSSGPDTDAPALGGACASSGLGSQDPEPRPTTPSGATQQAHHSPDLDTDTAVLGGAFASSGLDDHVLNREMSATTPSGATPTALHNAADTDTGTSVLGGAHASSGLDCHASDQEMLPATLSETTLSTGALSLNNQRRLRRRRNRKKMPSPAAAGLDQKTMPTTPSAATQTARHSAPGSDIDAPVFDGAYASTGLGDHVQDWEPPRTSSVATQSNDQLHNSQHRRRRMRSRYKFKCLAPAAAMENGGWSPQQQREQKNRSSRVEVVQKN